MVYQGIPKKRHALIDDGGHLIPLDKRGGASNYYMCAASGTLLGDGHLTVTGTQFKTDSFVSANYVKSSAGTAPIAAQFTDGTVTFYGDASQQFYYVVINQTL